MTASNKTVEQILNVLERHTNSPEQVKEIIRDLHLNVHGNKSVEETIKKLWEQVKK